MKLIQQMPGGDNIKAFTRIMHRTTDDDLVGEVMSTLPHQHVPGSPGAHGNSSPTAGQLVLLHASCSARLTCGLEAIK